MKLLTARNRRQNGGLAELVDAVRGTHNEYDRLQTIVFERFESFISRK